MRDGKKSPVRDLLRLVYRAWLRGRADQIPLLAAGIAFYAFLSLFPALAAFEFFYALVADPRTVVSEVTALTSVLPGAARAVIADQLLYLAERPRPSLGLGIVVAVVVEFWSTSSMIGNMMSAVNTAYRAPERRSIVRRRLLAFAMTLGTIAFLVAVCALVIIGPRLLYGAGSDGAVRWLLEAVRWLILLLLISVALPLVYHLSPSVTERRRVSWFSTGTLVAAALWLLASLGFSVYTATIGDYSQTFGVFGGVVVLILWLWVTVYAILLGAEINACQLVRL